MERRSRVQQRVLRPGLESRVRRQRQSTLHRVAKPCFANIEVQATDRLDARSLPATASACLPGRGGLTSSRLRHLHFAKLAVSLQHILGFEVDGLLLLVSCTIPLISPLFSALRGTRIPSRMENRVGEEIPAAACRVRLNFHDAEEIVFFFWRRPVRV